MSRDLYRVFVDEAGDRGWGGRSTPTFVLSAAIVRDEEADELCTLLDGVNGRLGKPTATVLHWAENVKTHAQRKFVAREIAGCSATITNVVVLKQAMMGSGTHLSDPSAMYNTAGCLNSALKPDDFGAFEPHYLMELVPRIYVRGNGRVASYGMNIVGPPSHMDATYPWWQDFVAACERRS